MNIVIRQANLADLPLISSLYHEEMQNGHFGKQTREITLALFKHVIETGSLIRHVMREDLIPKAEKIPAWIRIVTVNETFAGFLLCSPETPDIVNCIEIYLLAVVKAFRCASLGMKLIDFEQRQHPSGTAFYARCYPKSTWAISMLQKNGFKIESISCDSKVHYLRK